MEFGFAILAALILLGFMITGILGFQRVPQGYHYTVERLGKFTRTLEAGPRLIYPFLEVVSYKIDVREQVLEVPTQEIITKDNASVKVNGVVFFVVQHAARAAYEVRNYDIAILNLVTTNIRGAMGSMKLDEMLTQRDRISDKIMQDVDEATEPWGIKVMRVKIKDITPPKELSDAMTKQLRAEREKRAKIFEAEGTQISDINVATGHREAAILQAQGEKEAMLLKAQAEKEAMIMHAEAERQRDLKIAEGRERLSEAEALAVSMMAKAVRENGADLQAINYLVADKYVNAFTEMAKAPDKKVIYMPMEASQIVGALGGIGELTRDALQQQKDSKA